MWRLYIKPALGNRKITDINNLDIEHLHRSLARVKYNANRTLSLLNLLFNLMEKWNLRPPHTNPCRCVQRYKEDLRIRYLSSEEMARFTKEIRAELTQGVDEIVGTALSAKEIILEAQSDITTKYEEIQTIRSNLDEIVTNITAINERFVNSIDEFEITLNEAITSINDTKDSDIEAVNVQLNTEKEALVAELNQETNDEIKRVQTEGQKQINLAIAQADRAKNEANAVNHPLTTRTETGGTINIDWNINQDYLFNIASDTTFSFSNLPQNDEKGNFIQLIINATAAIKPVFPQNCVFAEDNSPDFVAGKTYQVMLQYIASLSKWQVAFVEY